MDLTSFSEAQRKIIAYIGDHPGATSVEIANAFKESRNTIAARLANLIKTPGVLTQTGNGGAGTPFAYRLGNGKVGEPSAPLRVKRRARRARPTASNVDVLLTLKVGKREALTVTVGEARDLLRQLLDLQRFFGAASS